MSERMELVFWNGWNRKTWNGIIDGTEKTGGGGTRE